MSDKKKELSDSEKLINGGIDLSKKELDELKGRGAEEAAVILQRRQMKLATMPGYKEFVQIQQKTEILKNMFQNKIEKETLKEAKVFKKSNEYKDKFTASNVGNLVSGDKKETTKRTSFIKKIFEAPISKALSRPSFMGGQNVSETMEQFLPLMKRIDDSKISYQNDKEIFERQQEELKETRHKEIMNVFLEATKRSRKASRQLEVKKKEVKKEEKPVAPPPPAPPAPPTPPAPPAPPVKAPPAPAAPPAAPPVTAKPAPPAPPAPPTAVPAPPPVVTKPTVVRPAITEAAKTATKAVGPKALVLGALVAAGFSKAAQANILANVEKESNFVPRSEDLAKWSPQTLFRLYGPPKSTYLDKNGKTQIVPNHKNTVRVKTIEDAQAIVSKGTVAVGDLIYGGRMGNDKPGDGFKYRGRGFIQLTGKDMYNRVGKLLNLDLVGNPDLANDPLIAAKIIPAFFKLKANERKVDISKFEDIDFTNKIVGSADVKSREQRKLLAGSYATEIDKISAENADMKKEMSASQPPMVIIGNQQNNNRNIMRPQSEAQPDVNPVLGR